MQHYLIKLVPPRPTFQADMSDREAALMERHAAYWADQMKDGRILVFGPVADPESGYGIAVVKADDEDEIRSLIAGDPVLAEGAGFRHEVFPMPGAISSAD